MEWVEKPTSLSFGSDFDPGVPKGAATRWVESNVDDAQKATAFFDDSVDDTASSSFIGGLRGSRAT